MPCPDTLIHGDCLEAMKHIADGSVDAIIADLPYGITACAFDTVIPFVPLWEAYKRVIKPNGAIVLTAAQPFTSALIMSNLKWFKYDWVWDKRSPTGFLNAKRMPLRSHESVLVFYNSQPTYNPQKYKKLYAERTGKGFTPLGQVLKAGVYGDKIKHASRVRSAYGYPKTIIEFPTGGGRTKSSNIHPTQKPVALLEYLVRTYTNPGDLVLDNCMGSATLPVACLNTGRHFIGIEQDDKYFAAGCARVRTRQLELASTLDL